MKNLILLFALIFSFTINCKEGIKKENYISENLPQTVKAIQSPLVFTKISETRNNFKIDGKLFESEYDIDGKLIQLQLTSGKSEGFSYEIYSEGKKIGTTQKDSWMHEPFYYKNENIGVLFIANGDEGGIWGYTVFMKIENKFVNLGFVEFSSVVDTPLNKFLELDQKNNYVIFNFLEPEIFYGNKINSSKLNLKIDIENLKLLNSSNDKPSNEPFLLNLNNTKFEIDFDNKKINAGIKTSKEIYFEKEYLIINQEIVDNNPHDKTKFKYFFVKKTENIILEKLEYSREVYVEQTDLCDINYIYLPQNEISISAVHFSDRNFLNLLVRDLNLEEVKKLILLTNKDYKCSSPLNQGELSNLLVKNPPNDGNVTKYNDIAYYLGENKQFDVSIYLLETILKKYPQRIVAWLNLADYYWETGNKKEAKNSYLKYITLMKSQQKDLLKIPGRVYNRIK